MRFILLGTSHCEPFFNPMKDEFEKVFDIPFSNKGVSALSIKSYFPRILAILNEFPDEKLFFINELPTGGRYENYLDNPRSKYKPLSIITPKFWPEGTKNAFASGEWKKHIFYYNVAKLAAGKIGNDSPYVHSKIIKKLCQFVVSYNVPLCEELEMYDAIYINSFIKNAGHNVVWFNTNTPVSFDKEMFNLSKKYDLKYILNQTLFSVIEKKYNKELVKLKGNTNVFPDGTHLAKNEWEHLIQEYFIPYFKSYIKDNK